MPRPAATSVGAFRHVILAMALVAIALKVLIPAGFMAAPAPVRGSLIVLCTGHGPQAVEAVVGAEKGPGHKSPAEKPPHDPPCAFAGHGVAAPAPQAGEPAAAPVAFETAAVRAGPHAELAPGRGLAAPPPPARGPPLTLI